MIEAIGGRKVMIVCSAVLIGVGLVWWKGDVPPNFLALLQWGIGLFIAGNGIEHAARAYGTPDTVPPVEVDTDHLEAKLDQANQGIALTNQALGLIIKKYGIDQ